MASYRIDSEYDDMDKGEVQKGYHCAWQIHYQLVFPVKYRKALLDEMVVKIIEETAEGIQQRYAIEMEALGMDKNHIHLLCPSQNFTRRNSANIQKHHCQGDIPKVSPDQKRTMGWRILV
ncbi:MAG: transposase [Alkaliphilus sp.]|nr:transposase [Alkaliphilus sp.]